MSSESDQEGVHIFALTPFALAFVGLFVTALASDPVVSTVGLGVVMVSMIVGAGYVGWRRGGALFILFSTVFAAVFIGFIAVPAVPSVAGLSAPLACDAAHPYLVTVAHEGSDEDETTVSFTQVCVNADESDGRPTMLPGLLSTLGVTLVLGASLGLGRLVRGAD